MGRCAIVGHTAGQGGEECHEITRDDHKIQLENALFRPRLLAWRAVREGPRGDGSRRRLGR